jgi:hypothetical protein
MWILFVLLSAFQVAAGTESKDSNFNQLTIKNWDDSPARPKVEDNRDNIVIEPLSINNVDKSVMENSLASTIADKKNRIEWRPKWYFDGAGGTRIASPVISADKSLIALIETAGKAPGPFFSRVVILNTASKSGLPCLKIIELPETKINQLMLVPASTIALATLDPQACFKQSVRVISLDLNSGQIKSVTPPISGNITGLAVTEDTVALKTSASGSVFIFSTDDLSKKTATYSSSFDGGQLYFTPDRKHLAVVGSSKIEFFNMEQRAGVLEGETKFPDKISPTRLVFLDVSGKNFAIIGSGKDAWIHQNNNFKIFSRKAGDLMLYDAENQLLVLETMVKNGLELYSYPTMKLSGSLIPKDLRPAHAGEPLAVLPFRDSYLIIDNHGNFTFINKVKQRWQKEFMLTANR